MLQRINLYNLKKHCECLLSRFSCVQLCKAMDCSPADCVHWNCSQGKSDIPLREVAAATAAKSLQSCPTLCDPIDGSPPGSAVPGILQARTLEWVAISFSNAGKVKSESEVAQSCPTLSDPMDCSPPGSSTHGLSRQEYWSGLPLPSPRYGLGRVNHSHSPVEKTEAPVEIQETLSWLS